MTNAPADKINEQGRYEWQWLSDNHNTRPNQIKEKVGPKFDIRKDDLDEMERITGVSRAKLRRRKKNNFVVSPMDGQAVSGKTPVPVVPS